MSESVGVLGIESDQVAVPPRDVLVLVTMYRVMLIHGRLLRVTLTALALGG